MKELDFTNAKLLKTWLTKVGNYREWQVKGTTDICTLTRMCVWAGVHGLGKLFMIIILLVFAAGLLLTLLSALSYFTVLLPEYLQAPSWLLDMSPVWLTLWLLGSLCAGVGFYKDGNIELFPEYMKFSKKPENSEKKEKTPSPTWIAIKEMYKSFKNKTCVKVKL
tara:strand:- start:209 stop:703 length:495 start_codon:yes stop_codon:yes gene_type:complete